MEEIICSKYGTKKERRYLIRHSNVINKYYPSLLLDDIVSWNIFEFHFLFKLDPREAESDYIYIYDFRKTMGYFKIKDISLSSKCIL
jgi:hypothetical protein